MGDGSTLSVNCPPYESDTSIPIGLSVINGLFTFVRITFL